MRTATTPPTSSPTREMHLAVLSALAASGPLADSQRRQILQMQDPSPSHPATFCSAVFVNIFAMYVCRYVCKRIYKRVYDECLNV